MIPLLRILVSFPIACFCGALTTDIVYAATADMIWADFSDWLLAAGIAIGGIAALIGAVALLVDRAARTLRSAWLVAFGSLFVLVAALFDNLVHSRDAWTSVVPAGLGLSAVTVLLTLITTWYAATRTAAAIVVAPYQGVRR
jgi:uncharacterized membrane protein